MTDAPELHCSACDAPMQPGDRFCEQCGSRSTVAPDRDGAPPMEAAGCHVCGAPADRIDRDGYCGACGALARHPAPRAEQDLLSAAAVSDQGRSHRRNEDAFFLNVNGDRNAAAVVCDGISSAAASNVAAQRAAAAAGDVLAAAITDGKADPRDSILGAISAAHEASARVVATTRMDRDAPSCTLVAALCRDGEIVIGWLGDSRAYWLADGESRQLTVDDSWAQEQTELGLLTSQEAERDPRAHAITRWVGSDAPGGPPNIETLSPATPGRLILCTDGLWNYLAGPDELTELIAQLPSGAGPVAIARSLADVAMTRGGRDDITIAVVDVEPPNPSEKDPT
jgi:PPM family protein phosphatase